MQIYRGDEAKLVRYFASKSHIHRQQERMNQTRPVLVPTTSLTINETVETQESTEKTEQQQQQQQQEQHAEQDRENKVIENMSALDLDNMPELQLCDKNNDNNYNHSKSSVSVRSPSLYVNPLLPNSWLTANHIENLKKKLVHKSDFQLFARASYLKRGSRFNYKTESEPMFDNGSALKSKSKRQQYSYSASLLDISRMRSNDNNMDKITLKRYSDSEQEEKTKPAFISTPFSSKSEEIDSDDMGVNALTISKSLVISDHSDQDLQNVSKSAFSLFTKARQYFVSNISSQSQPMMIDENLATVQPIEAIIAQTDKFKYTSSSIEQETDLSPDSGVIVHDD